jgi:peroxin-5
MFTFLSRCLELKPDNLVALSTLATSYTNESMQRLAFQSLLKWLQYNEKYSHLLTNDEQAQRLIRDIVDNSTNNSSASSIYMNSLGIVHIRDFLDLQEIFLRAVRESSTKSSLTTTENQQIDPNLQNCLGILFHLSGEYDKAADCFKTALHVKPDDHLLWNKLGATLANNNRNEEAIDAYFQALKLCPGFVRARYNLGIGCMNLGAYKESVEHFLTALDQQNQANINGDMKMNPSVSKQQQMSETIWNTLRLSLSYLNRQDLYSACLSKNLDELKKEFNI